VELRVELILQVGWHLPMLFKDKSRMTNAIIRPSEYYYFTQTSATPALWYILCFVSAALREFNKYSPGVSKYLFILSMEARSVFWYLGRTSGNILS